MQEGLNALLAAVSRSFYLTIRVLPRAVRSPIGLAYLLARMSDTIADSASAPPGLRLGALRELGESLGGTGPMPDLTPFGTGISDSERVLLEKAAELHRLLGASPDRAEIVRVLEVILSGQSLDLTRFACGAAALTKADELEDYTYRVAGCVGEFWTRICDRHLADYSSVALSQMAQWGVSFGKGLQLINILRDAPMDLAQGRCYLPLEELPDRNPERLKTAPESARPVTERWTLRAREHLDDGLRYIEAVRPWRLRLACFLPWAIGIRTLRRMEQTPPLEQAERVKIGRREVRALFFLGVLASFGNRFLRRVARRVQAD